MDPISREGSSRRDNDARPECDAKCRFFDEVFFDYVMSPLKGQLSANWISFLADRRWSLLIIF